MATSPRRPRFPPRAHHPDYFFSRGSGRKSAAITGEYCLSCAQFVPTSSCDRAVVHPVSSPIGWVMRPERNCGASLVGTLSPGVTHARALITLTIFSRGGRGEKAQPLQAN